MEAPAFKPSILDRAISAISPVAGMKRLAARQPTSKTTLHPQKL